MPAIKPALSDEQVITLLQEHFPTPLEHLTVINSGQIAQTYSFTAGGQEYIVRFNRDNMGANFPKEAFIAGRITSPRIPIPRVVHIGRFQELHYSITVKVPGRPLDQLPAAEYARLLPEVIRTLDAIHHIDVSNWPPRYGVFDDHGVGLSASWRSYLTSIRDEEEDWNFYGKWHTLFDTTFLERDVFDSVYNEMSRLLDRCPEERNLLHGCYGFSNVIAHEGSITGVLDWIDAKYGDFVYDIAWLDFWAPEAQHGELFRHYYARQGISVPAYGERLRCYQCYIGMDALRFAAKSNQPNAYRWSHKRIFELIS
ncbi:MAG TPA: aminoglycoside phosphotransferase family protein [Ktedonobacteraceae bacterium]